LIPPEMTRHLDSLHRFLRASAADRYPAPARPETVADQANPVLTYLAESPSRVRRPESSPAPEANGLPTPAAEDF
jgi:hypothetical protein